MISILLSRREILLSASAILVASPALAAEALLGGYKGDDAGYLVLSLTARGLAQQYRLSLCYRRSGEKASGYLSGGHHILNIGKYDIQTSHSNLHALSNFFMYSSDDDYSEQGDVLIESLAPGHYEIFNVHNFYSTGRFEYTTKLDADISIPFEIRSGRATYIGEFKGVAVYGRNIFGVRIPAGARFIVSDQHERDLAIARQKNAAISDVDLTVPNVDTLHIPQFSMQP